MFVESYSFSISNLLKKNVEFKSNSALSEGQFDSPEYKNRKYLETIA